MEISVIQVFSHFKNPRIVFAFLFDSFVGVLSFWLAFGLRFETLDFSRFPVLHFGELFILSELFLILSFFLNGLYQGVWRFSSIHDLMRVIKASLLGTILSLSACYFLNQMHGVPKSVFLIQFLLLVVGLGGGRFFYRFLKDRTVMKAVLDNTYKDVKKVLIVGAGRAGEKLLRDIHATPGLKLRVVGFIDDDRYKWNAVIHNVKVYGGASIISSYVADLDVDKVFIAMPSASGEKIKEIVRLCETTPAEIKILPRMDHLLSSKVELSLLRNIKIEDLLGRDEVQLDMAHLSSMIGGKVILVTGAGGSIGSELCFQIAKFSPELIVMVDYCELFMYELEMRFKEAYPNVPYFPKIVDVRNATKIDGVFSSFTPDIVFHAAAYKHVPMMEYNPGEAIETNIRGTKIIAEAALKFGAERFIMVSTDKAVNPTNVMGASKRIAEMVVTNLSKKISKTKFVSVRFGNVLGSNGSVIPLFTKQIEERKSITVTHPDIIRYFMSIPEAAQLVLQSASMGEGGEIFVLEMGEPVKIVDLAKEMIRLAGLVLGKDINIVYSGLRPGEKLFEELFSDKESFEFTHHGKIRKACFRPLIDSFESGLEKLLSLQSVDLTTIVYLMKDLVPEFKHYSIEENIESTQTINH